MGNENPEELFIGLFESKVELPEGVIGGLDGVFGRSLFRSKLEEISRIEGAEKTSKFGNHMKRSMDILNGYCMSIEYLEPQPEQTYLVVERLYNILKLFPGYLLARRELINFLKTCNNQQTIKEETRLEQEGKLFLDDFIGRILAQLEGKYGGIETKFFGSDNMDINYIKVLTKEVDNFSNLNNLLLFMNYFYDEGSYRILHQLGSIPDSKIENRVAKTLLEECETYKKELEKRFEANTGKTYIKDEDKIKYIWECRQNFINHTRNLENLVQKLPDIIGSVDNDLRDIIFREGLTYEQVDISTFSDIVSKCRDDLLAIKGRGQPSYKVANWEDIQRIIGKISSLKGIQVASQQIRRQQEDKKQRSLDDDTTSFLDECVSLGLPPDDIGEALDFYNENRDAFTDRVSEDKRKELVTFFTQVKQYDDEWSMVERFCRGRRVRHVVQAFHPNKFHYVLGGKARNLLERLDQIETKDTQEMIDIHTQMVSTILEQNALKQFLGMYNYTELMQHLLKKTESDSFFSKLCVAEYITDTQLQEFQTFAYHFELERIPIHEKRKQATTRNNNFIAEIVLGNAGVVSTFIKFYKKDCSDTDRENAAREKFLLSGPGSRILNEHNVGLPLAIEDAHAKDYQGNEYNVLALGFINAHTLDEIVNDRDLYEQYAPLKVHIFEDAVTQLAAIHNSTKDLESKRSKDFKLDRVNRNHNYFISNLKEQLEQDHSDIKQHASNIIEAIAPLANYLADLSEGEKGVYYKDANPRNVMVQFQETELKAVMHIDYELGVKLLGEVDLFKLLRNGRGFEEFDTNVDYITQEGEHARRGAESYLSKKRYLTRKEEEKFIFTYNKARSRTFDFVEAQKRFDVAAIHTHIWYVAWFSHKMKEEDMSDRAIHTLRNRVNYHLMEAKLMLDYILHDTVSYIADETAREKLVRELNLDGLRKTLDRIPLNQNITYSSSKVA